MKISQMDATATISEAARVVSELSERYLADSGQVSALACSAAEVIDEYYVAFSVQLRVALGLALEIARPESGVLPELLLALAALFHLTAIILHLRKEEGSEICRWRAPSRIELALIAIYVAAIAAESATVVFEAGEAIAATKLT